ncbi:MAG: hypothetical protein WKG07_04625 [Hymenobacter sp.]
MASHGLAWETHAEASKVTRLLLEKCILRAVTCVLNDSSQDLDGWGEMTRWLGQDFFGKLTTNGVSAVAWVLPRNLRRPRRRPPGNDPGRHRLAHRGHVYRRGRPPIGYGCARTAACRVGVRC